MASNTIDPLIRARFKETARRIIAKDRAARRLGASQNTIGEIERAMVTAYLIGTGNLVLSSEPDNSSTALAWELLPPRAREVLDFLTFGLSRRYPGVEGKIDGLTKLQTSDKRWHLGNVDGTPSELSFGDSGVQTLVRLGLLAAAPNSPAHLIITEVGLETAKAYWERADNNDPTLPIHSVRA